MILAEPIVPLILLIKFTMLHLGYALICDLSCSSSQ